MNHWVETDDTEIVIAIVIANTAETESTATGNVWTQTQSPSLSGWVKFEHKFELLNVEGDVLVLKVEVVLTKVVEWRCSQVNGFRGSSGGLVRADDVHELVNVVDNLEVLDFRLSIFSRNIVKIDYNFKLVVTGIVSQSMFTLISDTELEQVLVESADLLVVELLTLASALADIGTTAGALTWWSIDRSLAITAHWNVSSANLSWTSVNLVIAQTSTSSAGVGLVWELSANWVKVTVVRTSAIDDIVLVAAARVGTNLGELLATDALVEVLWGWCASLANAFSDRTTVGVLHRPANSVALAALEIGGGWAFLLIADALAAVTTITRLSVVLLLHADISALDLAWETSGRSTLDGSDGAAVEWGNAFADVACIIPSGTDSVGVLRDWVFAASLIELTSSATVAWSDDELVALVTRSDWTSLLEALS